MRSFTALSLAVIACVLSTGTEAATNPFPMPKCHGFILEEATIDTIQARLKYGHLTSHQLVECYVNRVNKINPFMKYVLFFLPNFPNFFFKHMHDALMYDIMWNETLFHVFLKVITYIFL
jgi:hypothetical protein